MTELLTVGHGTLDVESFAALLTGAGVDLLVDVRRYPGSRANPQVKREAMEEWLPSAGIAYRWDPRLGGRRSLTAADDNVDTWWRVKAFRAYASYTRSEEFAAGFSDLMDDVSTARVVVCCSETVWWRCHRRLISDVTSLTTEADVVHLGHDGKLSPHPVAEGARVTPDGLVVWDDG